MNYFWKYQKLEVNVKDTNWKLKNIERSEGWEVETEEL